VKTSNLTMNNLNLIGVFIVLNLEYFMYTYYMATLVYNESIVFIYVSMNVDNFCNLCPAGQFGSIEYEIK
jgi:hypothetical protein